MYSKFPFSMENLPRQKRFGCLSLKFGCIFSGLLLILYCILALANCAAILLYPNEGEEVSTQCAVVIIAGLIHCFTMLFTTMMLIGTIREKHRLMKPWIVWISCQLMAGLLLFVFMTTMNMIHHTEVSLLVYIAEFMSLLIRFYMLVLVSSYAKDLEEESANERVKRLMDDIEPKYSAV